MHTLSEISRNVGRGVSAVVLLGLLFFGSLYDLKAQQDPYPDAEIKKELSRAEAYLVSFKNDSALAIANHLVMVLNRDGQLDAPIGIQVQLTEALANEMDYRGSPAVSKLLHVAQKSKEKGLWKVHVRACLGLALLYERIGRKESSREQLDIAGADIERNGLDSLYSYFAIRRSSWERLFGDRKLALFYAREALRTAIKHHQVLEEAIGHMLMNMLLPETSLNERLSHCLKSVRLYQQLDDHTGCSYMYGAIAKIQLHRKDFSKALAFSDSTILAANRAITGGNEEYQSLGNYYRFRGKVYEELGNLDSALANMQKGYEIELALKDKDISDKIVEIDARYQNQYKQQQIEEQQLALRLKNNQLRLSAIIGVLVLVLAVGLFAGFRKQRRAKRKLLQQNILIQDQATQLENLDAAKSRFFANVSHELRTPLSLVVGPITTLLKEEQQTEKQARLLKMAIQSTRQLEALVNNILDLQKLEVGKMSLHPEPTALESFFLLHLDQFQSLAQWKQIYYTHNIQLDPALIGELDREKCRQVLYNLLSNAFKFTPAQGKVEVAVWVKDSCLSFQVTDTGPGISPDDVAYIFDRFYQSSHKSSYLVGGTGIGLSLCREYARLMSGDTQVTSSPGKGSVFFVWWPITILAQTDAPVVPLQIQALDNLYPVFEPAPASTARKNNLKSASTYKPTILIVEDNPGLQEYLATLLSDQYQVIIAENGEVALQKIASCSASIDLIMSDLMMPVMDGYQLLEKLRAGDDTRHLPIIMLTARAEPTDRLQALRIGVDDYLTKPFDEEELLVRIANLLKNQSVRRQEAAEVSNGGDTHSHLSETDQVWLENFEKYIQDNLDSDIVTVTSLSETFAMSESTLFRQLKRLTGLSPQQYLQEIRLNEARLLLEKGRYCSISALASQVGYKDARTFSRSYKKRFGKLPTEYA